METVSAPVAESRVKAMNRVAKGQGISRSEFIRRAIDRELMALS
ncbi:MULTISPECIES: ribbon-helix-helix protein, CopG family [unclassified Bifidobacterium]|nr:MULTISPECIES: ribbon-helix-helix protein, CopG family [unclassified Bifidobacterium]WEV65441.1 ribbon-helix-helix protein, CopG family [Bifidobacterium sp. ESL0764]WEV75754.1 ribbon-helix-helix protein, CopG family [Bifidobacterium sp. ESL0800]